MYTCQAKEASGSTSSGIDKRYVSPSLPASSFKAAMVRFTKWAALEFSPYKIRVNCIAPGWIDPEYDKTPGYRAKREWVNPTLPLKQMVTSSELAEIADFLASPAGRSITGQTINVDAGDSLLNAPLEAYHFDKD